MSAIRRQGTTVYNGECVETMTTLAALGVRVDSIVTDPPYHLTTTKRFGGDGAPAQFGTDGLYQRASKGFMGKEWDGGDIAFDPATWRRAYDLLKPGGYLLAFSGSRTYHRMACAIEDAGFEIRDQLMWLYGTGFPKSHDMSKAIDKAAGAERPRVAATTDRRGDGTVYAVGHSGQLTSNDPITAAAAWEGWGTALKPAHEPIVMARKPFPGTVAANVLEHGTGAINIDACRVGTGEARQTKTGGMGRKANPVYGEFANGSTEDVTTTLGRFPANVMHDGSPEVLEAFAAYGERPGSTGTFKRKASLNYKSDVNYAGRADEIAGEGYGDSGTAARFFYCAKASKRDRAGSKHPTVKPVALIEYLCRLVTRPGGLVLDPFAGSGTLADAWDRCVLIEREPEYFNDIMARLERRDTGRPVPSRGEEDLRGVRGRDQTSGGVNAV